MSVRSARALLAADSVLAVSATTVLIIGFARVFFFEKGASYYFHNAPFIAKIALFALVALLSIYPTVQFLSWRSHLKQGAVPPIVPAKLRRIRAFIHLELIGVVLIILCAVWMARGIGYFGG